MEIPLYQDGQWTKCAHPVAADDSGDSEELMNKSGYTHIASFHPGSDERTVTLAVWGDGKSASYPGRRAAKGSPEYLVDIRFSYGNETVAVAGIVDLMNLLAKWTPVVQIGLACDDALERWVKTHG